MSAPASVLERATRILEAFDRRSPTQTASELSRRTGIPMASTHRLVGEMLRLGLLERGPDRLLRVGVRTWELGWRSTTALGLREVALPFMEDVLAAVRQHTQLGVLEGADVLYVERLSARGRTSRTVTRVGGRLPAHSCSAGLVLLAHATPEVRERVLAGPLRRYTTATVTDPDGLGRLIADAHARGSAVTRGTVQPHTAGIAAPVRGPDGEVVAALSVVLPNEPPAIAAATPTVLAAARGISRALSAPRTPPVSR